MIIAMINRLIKFGVEFLFIFVIFFDTGAKKDSINDQSVDHLEAGGNMTDKILPVAQKSKSVTYVQTELKAHEDWGRLILKHPKAGAILHFLAGRVGQHNAVVMSHKTIADLIGISTATVTRNIKVLRDNNWLEIRKVGATNSVNAYVLNSRVAWTGKLENKRYALFSANVIVSEEEQDEAFERIESQPELRKLPSLGSGDAQLPSGSGLEPPSQPSLDGMEPDLPTLSNHDPAQLDLEDFTGRPEQPKN